VLVENSVDAFVFEPGHSASLYYADFSQYDWEPWEPEERPLIGLILPVDEGELIGRLVFLAPKFEETRLRLLDVPVPRKERLKVVTYEEHWDPYATLRDELFGGKEDIKLMVDEQMRDFITRGLGKAGFEPLEMSEKAQQIQQIKSPAEIEIIRAVNTGTVEAVRAASKCKSYIRPWNYVD
jgi:Xaa-Pro aminopeptidase